MWSSCKNLSLYQEKKKKSKHTQMTTINVVSSAGSLEDIYLVFSCIIFWGFSYVRDKSSSFLFLSGLSLFLFTSPKNKYVFFPLILVLKKQKQKTKYTNKIPPIKIFPPAKITFNLKLFKPLWLLPLPPQRTEGQHLKSKESNKTL